jgi:hypothetical protein
VVHVSFSFMLMVFNMLGGTIYTLKENTEALVVACKETGLGTVHGYLSISASRTNSRHKGR